MFRDNVYTPNETELFNLSIISFSNLFINDNQ